MKLSEITNYSSWSTLKKLDYPANLLVELYGGCGNGNIDCFGTIENPCTEDQQKGLDFVLSLLDQNEADLIRYRYIEKLSFKEIAEKSVYCPGYVRPKINQCLRLLRNPKRARYIVKGYDAYTKELIQ